jgi:hypothetical protein
LFVFPGRVSKPGMIKPGERLNLRPGLRAKRSQDDKKEYYSTHAFYWKCSEAEGTNNRLSVVLTYF